MPDRHPRGKRHLDDPRIQRALNIAMWLCIAFLLFVLVGSVLGFVHITGIHATHIPPPQGPAA